MNRRTRDNQTDILWIRHNIAHNPIWAVSNAPLALAPRKVFHIPILSTLEIHGVQVKKEREIFLFF